MSDYTTSEQSYDPESLDKESHEYVQFNPGTVLTVKSGNESEITQNQSERSSHAWEMIHKVKTMLNLTNKQLLKLQSIFSILDRNNDNGIMIGEILHTMRSLGEALTEAELQDLMFELDIDHDGTIDFAELCLFIAERIGMKKLDNDFKEFFDALDINGNDRLSKKDICNILRNFEIEFDNEVVSKIIQAVSGHEDDHITSSDLKKFLNNSASDFNLIAVLNDSQ